MKGCLCALFASLLVLPIKVAARDAVLPAGTLLQCTLNEPDFSTNTASLGDPVLCHVRGLGEFGQQPFPRGTYLVGHLEAAKNPGHFVGKGYLDLHFDRIGVPSGDMPLEAKIIAAGKYRVDREGKIHGKGHAKRDAVEWMFPPLWPWKVLMLPARGPRPALKGETVLTLRLMDDVEIPQLAQTVAPEWHPFGERTPQSYRIAPGSQFEPASAMRVPPSNTIQGPQVITTSLHTFYTSYPHNSSDLPDGIITVPGMPVFVLKSGSLLSVNGYSCRGNRMSYSLTSGGIGIITFDEVNWPATLRLNEQRGLRVTLQDPASNQEGR